MSDTGVKKMEETPSLRDKVYRTLSSNVPVLIVRFDTQLRRIYVNPAWEKAIGLSAADVIGKGVNEIPELPAIANLVDKLQKVLKSGAPEKIEFSWASRVAKPSSWNLSSCRNTTVRGK